MKFLDSDRNEGRSLKEIATEIVDGYHDLLEAGIKKPVTTLRPGMLIKTPFDAKVRRVAYLNDGAGRVWIVNETSSYGWYGPLAWPAWGYCEEFYPKKRVEIDGKGKMVEMSDEDIEAVWSNPDWSVGQQLSLSQRSHVYEIVATGPLCVLMRNVMTGDIQVDSNKSLEKHYKAEIKGLGSGW